ncbi:MAG: sensor histidine kinase [Candidatus Hodarchaeota archaeon]
MALSVTQRLTVTVAFLSGLILAFAGVAFYLYMGRGIEFKALEKANAAALAADNTILRQLDEDILVDYTGGRVEYNRLHIPFDHWAVFRKNGRLEESKGIFKDRRVVPQGSPTQVKRISENEVFAIASVQLIPEKNLKWDDIPKIAQATVMANVQGGMFLNAKREVSGRLNLLAVNWLLLDHILEITMLDTGELFDMDSEDLPDQIPNEMEIKTISDHSILEPRIVAWQAYNGELIIIVEGRLENEEPAQAAINRLGEQFVISQNGMIERKLEDSRLFVVVAHDMNSDFAKIQFVGRTTLISGLFLWFLITSVAWQVTKRALRPVNEMIEQARRIDPSQLNERLPVGSVDDELSRVARTVNDMLDRIQVGYRREQQFTGDASHEMRNPLAKMIAEIDLALSQHRGQKEHQETLVRLRKYAKGMQQMVESLLTLARLDGGLKNLELKPFDVADLAIEILKPLPQDSAQRICLEFGKSTRPMQAIGHRQLIGVLLSNLIDNALRYSPPQSTVYLRISGNAENIHIEVEDEGPGIPAEQIALAFNRFHRLEKSRSRQTGGIGLGLSIVKAIADIHSTTVVLTRGAKQGTRATLTLLSSNHNDDR